MKNLERFWWKEAVVYQIYPRSYKDTNGDGIGDIKGIIEKLDYIQSLGVTAIWLNPIYKSPMDDMGYDIADYKAIDPLFGTMDDFDELLAQAEKRGIKIIMDLVVNHTSDEHEWFQSARKSKDSPYRDYYIWRNQPNNWKSFFYPTAWTKRDDMDQYYLHLFSQRQPDLNWDNPKVEQEVHDIMRFWLDKGIGGWRMDVINLISKPVGLPDVPEGKHIGAWVGYANRFHEFMQNMNREVLSKYDIMTVGETPAATPEIALLTVAPERKELQTLFQFDGMDLDHGDGGYWTGKKIDVNEWRNRYSRWHKGLYNKGWQSNYIQNHDQARAVSRFGDDGEYRVESAKMLALWNLTQCGTPYIYQGEELGMTNHPWQSPDEWQDVEMINAHHFKQQRGEKLADYFAGMSYRGRDNSRTPMQWDASENAGFSKAKPWLPVNPNHVEVNVESEDKDPNSVLNFYRKLVALRKESLTLIYGDQTMLDDSNDKVIAYTRTLEGKPSFLILLNFRGEAASVNLDGVNLDNAELLFSNYEDASIINRITDLQPWECQLYRL
ncbi:MAG: glycoside hydrolase family 13 protein [Alphaproteobacteria bacterium]